MLYSLYTLHATYRRAVYLKEELPELTWVASTSFWMRNGLAGYLIGSAFLDMLGYDPVWYFLLYASLLGPLLNNYLRAVAEQPDEPLDSNQQLAPPELQQT
jgi:hypothetical protein